MRRQGEGEYGMGGGGESDRHYASTTIGTGGRVRNRESAPRKRNSSFSQEKPGTNRRLPRRQPTAIHPTHSGLPPPARGINIPSRVNEITIQCDFLPLFKQARRVMSWICLSVLLCIVGTCGGNATALAEPATNRLLPNL
jgi:hypothetical protein